MRREPCAKLCPASMQAEAKIVKLVADAQLVRHKILEYLEHSHRAAAACIRAEDIGVFPEGQTVRFTFGVDAAERGFFEKNEQLLPGVERMLGRNFCNTFKGELVDKEKAGIGEESEEDEEEEVFDYRPARTFPGRRFRADRRSERAQNCNLSVRLHFYERFAHGVRRNIVYSGARFAEGQAVSALYDQRLDRPHAIFLLYPQKERRKKCGR